MPSAEKPSGPSNLRGQQRLVLAFSGMVGAIGVMAAAAASHGDSRNLSAMATICLAHGPALLALGIVGRTKWFTWVAFLLAGGTALFVADLAVREWLGHGLFAGAAPLGGMGMIAGWLGLVLAAVLAR